MRRTYERILSYPITTPAGTVKYPPKGTYWSRTEGQWLALVAAGLAFFGRNGDGSPSFKRYLSEAEGVVPSTWWAHEDAGHTDEASKELAAFDLDVTFDTPKPKRLINRILQIATSPGDLILDSFAGSGTTGHATLEINQGDDGKRRFILVEMDEMISTRVTKERLRKVVEGYEPVNGRSAVSGLGGGFRFCTLGEPLFDSDGNVSPAVTFPDLAAHVFFCETGSPIPRRADGASPLIGAFQGRAVYLLHSAAAVGVASAKAATC